eukprot:jgi/Picre1/32729/NNA_008074.t1
MKFGKRLEAEAERRWLESYVDYKALKKAIKKDISEGDLGSAEFRLVKAVKKRNRHMMSIAMDEFVQKMKPIQFLATQRFFTSLKLASMKTRLDVVEKGMPGMEAMSVDKAMEEYSCAIFESSEESSCADMQSYILLGLPGLSV